MSPMKSSVISKKLALLQPQGCFKLEEGVIKDLYNLICANSQESVKTRLVTCRACCLKANHKRLLWSVSTTAITKMPIFMKKPKSFIVGLKHQIVNIFVNCLDTFNLNVNLPWHVGGPEMVRAECSLQTLLIGLKVNLLQALVFWHSS